MRRSRGEQDRFGVVDGPSGTPRRKLGENPSVRMDEGILALLAVKPADVQSSQVIPKWPHSAFSVTSFIQRADRSIVVR